MQSSHSAFKSTRKKNIEKGLVHGYSVEGE